MLGKRSERRSTCLDVVAAGNTQLQKSDCGVDLGDFGEGDDVDGVLPRLESGPFFMALGCSRAGCHALAGNWLGLCTEYRPKA